MSIKTYRVNRDGMGFKVGESVPATAFRHEDLPAFIRIGAIEEVEGPPTLIPIEQDVRVMEDDELVAENTRLRKQLSGWSEQQKGYERDLLAARSAVEKAAKVVAEKDAEIEKHLKTIRELEGKVASLQADLDTATSPK